MECGKLEAITKWPLPRNIKQLQAFMGLIGYYRCFDKNYASIATALTYLLKKDSFQWTDITNTAFI